MKKIRENQERIYRELYETHKGSPMAVSSESLAHKSLRFNQIVQIFAEDKQAISVHDIGMGVADLYAFLDKTYNSHNITYSGTEILPEFVEEASKRFPQCNFYCRDIAEQAYEDQYDYVVMSGVFHQRRETSIPDWEKFSQRLIKNAFQMSRKGIAFNFISPYVDFYQTQVYYCNMFKLIQFIRDELSRFFSVQHNYALFEFTVFVYQEKHIKSEHPEQEFQKYFKI